MHFLSFRSTAGMTTDVHIDFDLKKAFYGKKLLKMYAHW